MEMVGIIKEANHKSLSLEMLVGGWKHSYGRENFSGMEVRIKSGGM